MPVLVLVFGLVILVWFWIARRGSTLTRICRWRLDRRTGEGHWHCLACGTVCDLPKGQNPRHCLRHIAGQDGLAPPGSGP